jgi:NitT/TauT family transport system ATP-binding protein
MGHSMRLVPSARSRYSNWLMMVRSIARSDTRSVAVTHEAANAVPAGQGAAELLRVEGLSKTYETKSGTITALGGVTFLINRGDFVCIVGPSGCGKTTLLMCIAGLIDANAGRVLVHGKEIKGTSPGMLLIFQDYARSLFPWRTVFRNVYFGVEKKHELSRQQKEDATHEALRAVGLEQFRRQYPWELSGGMQQRVALARGLAHRPDIMLLDEPFASVDAQTRADLEDTLLGIWREYSQTILFVTHDIEEAIYLSNKVLILGKSPARILKEIPIDLDYPRHQLLTREKDAFVKYRHEIYQIIRGPARAGP